MRSHAAHETARLLRGPNRATAMHEHHGYCSSELGLRAQGCTSLATEVVAAAAACASRDAPWMAVDRALMAGAASGLASTSVPASCTERVPTTARMHTISSAARRPCKPKNIGMSVILVLYKFST